MADFGSGDFLFIVLILALIHGIMLAIARGRSRRQRSEGRAEAEDT